MTRWTAVTPLKPGARKTRLAPSLSEDERAALSDRIAAHVIDRLGEEPAIGRVLLLAAADLAGLAVERRADGGAGLNAELDRVAAAVAGPLLVVHADLPFVTGDDIAALIAAADVAGAAIAPDRAGVGTNALALARRPAGFRFRFGADSGARHRRALPGAAIVRRAGLAFDVDTPADLAAMRAQQRTPSASSSRRHWSASLNTTPPKP